MNLITMLVGSGFILLGLWAEYNRRFVPEKLRKLEPMKKFWGEKKGTVLFFFSYVIMPIVLGTVFIVGGVNGVGFMDMLKQL